MLLSSFSFGEQNTYEPCENIKIQGKKIDLTENETRLVCGSGEKNGPWENIPPWQAKLHFKAILQKRGFHKAEFILKDDLLIVVLNDPVTASKISETGAPAQLDLKRKRKIAGEILTPEKLNELEDWIRLEAAHLGYPCPNIELIANENTGEINVKMKSGEPKLLIGVESETNAGFSPEILRRYDAFNLGEVFDIYKTILTERRTVDDDIVWGTHFQVGCTPTGAVLNQTVFAGKPRLVRLGFGVDTEQGPLFRGTWRHSRFGKKAHAIESSLMAAYNVQEFRTDLRWYHKDQISERKHLKGEFELKREKEKHYEFLSTQIRVAPATIWDTSDSRWNVDLGPAWLFEKTVVGVGPANQQSFILRGRTEVTSHPFEFYLTDPQTGSRFGLEVMFAHKSLLAQMTALKTSLSGIILWNYKKYSPPLWVFGLRTRITTTVVPNSQGDLENISPTFRSYLGGSEDMRGFGRKELPDSKGALNAAYLGAEIRFFELLPFQIQPLVFVDGAVMSNQRLNLNWPLYWSPGIGLRWASPIGIFRTEFSHGFLYSPTPTEKEDLSHYQFYLAYGEEF